MTHSVRQATLFLPHSADQPASKQRANVVARLRALACALVLGSVCGAAAAQNASWLDEAGAQSARRLVDNGIRHEHAEGVNRDFATAHDYYCAAARAGYGDALVRLGWMYANGRGVPHDDAVAHALFARAAGWGHEMGARLASVIRAGEPRLPPCMQLRAAEPSGAPTASGGPGPARRSASSGPTPQVAQPAEFRRPPSTVERKRIVEAVLRMAPQFRLDPRLVMAVMSTESNFDPMARSPKNAMGLMQLIPETAERFAVRDAYDPIENLRGGMAYLRWLLAYFRGDVTLALAGYNAGEGAVDRFRGVPPFSETLAYVQRIRAQYPFDRHPYDPRATAPSFAMGPLMRQVSGQ